MDAESLFPIMRADRPPIRTPRSFAERACPILDGKSQVDIIGYLRVGPGGSADWNVESSEISLSTYNRFTDTARDRVVLANFARRASGDPPVRYG